TALPQTAPRDDLRRADEAGRWCPRRRKAVSAWRDAARHGEIHESFAADELVLGEQPRGDAVELGDALGAEVDAKPGEPVHHPRGVRIPLEQPPLDRAHAFVNSVAEEEAAIVDRDHGTLSGHEFAIHIDDRHVGSPAPRY